MKNMFYSLFLGALCISLSNNAGDDVAPGVLKKVSLSISHQKDHITAFVKNSATSMVTSIKAHPYLTILALVTLGVTSKVVYDHLYEEDDATCCGSVCNIPKIK